MAAIDLLVYMKMRALTKSHRFENQGHHRRPVCLLSHKEANGSGGEERKWNDNRAKPMLSELLLPVRPSNGCDSLRRKGEQGATAGGKVVHRKTVPTKGSRVVTG